ncbi:hypothetical protein ONK27_28635, partial [Salmonella enterica subsp. enterica serovar Virginia]|nr:hypothetical protein [Salmonella enterica subsp. enterica serovar Virginia]
ALVFIISMLAIIATGVDDFSAFASVVATLNNLGPGLGVVADNYLGAKILYATLTSKGRAATETVVPFGAIFKRALILSLTNPKA